MKNLYDMLREEDAAKTAHLILEVLMPYLNGKVEVEDEIMDVVGVSDYLKVKTSWVYKKVQYKEIPFTHMGKYPRFRRSEIDAWFNADCPTKVQQFKSLKVV